MNVLLTGALGLLGQQVWLDLINNKNVDLILALYHNKGHAHLNIQKSIIVRGDLRDPQLFSSLYSSYGIDSIIHLGANAIVKNSEKAISDTFHTNILGTTYLLEAAKNAKINRFIYMSTDKVFGDQGAIKYTENMPLNGRNAYELSKVCADITAQNFNSYGLKTFCVRSCNMFGLADTNFSRIVPGFISKYIKNESPTVYSDSVNRVREFINVADTSNAINAILTYSGESRIFNLGSGFIKTIPEMAEYIYSRAKNILGDHLTCEKYVVKNKDQFFPEIDFQVIDYTLAQKELGYSPITSTNIDVLMDNTIKYYMNYFGVKHENSLPWFMYAGN